MSEPTPADPPQRPTGPRQGGSYDAPDLTEPDLPRTAKVRPKALRTGWTTGTCASAATRAAVLCLLTDLPEVCFVEVGDITGHALRTAVEEDVGRCVFTGMAGKLTKLASGVLMTHYTRSRGDVGQLGDITRAVGAHLPDVGSLAAAVDAASTGRHAYELWQRASLLRAAGDELCRRAQDVLERFTDGRVALQVAMVDFAGAHCVAATRPEWVA